MKTTRISSKAKTLTDLLKKARRRTLLLETTDGHRFVLASIDGWQAYELGDEGDITKNKKLMEHLASRRSNRPSASLAEVRAELGLK
jgi:hypothetical protein